jgi:hypothetical protein
MSFYLLQEDEGQLLMEDESGSLLLEEEDTAYWGGQIATETAKITPTSYQVRDNLTNESILRW